MKSLLDILRDKFTDWWLTSVCDCPEATLVYCTAMLERYRAETSPSPEQPYGDEPGEYSPIA